MLYVAEFLSDYCTVIDTDDWVIENAPKSILQKLTDLGIPYESITEITTPVIQRLKVLGLADIRLNYSGVITSISVFEPSLHIHLPDVGGSFDVEMRIMGNVYCTVDDRFTFLPHRGYNFQGDGSIALDLSLYKDSKGDAVDLVSVLACCSSSVFVYNAALPQYVAYLLDIIEVGNGISTFNEVLYRQAVAEHKQEYYSLLNERLGSIEAGLKGVYTNKNLNVDKQVLSQINSGDYSDAVKHLISINNYRSLNLDSLRYVRRYAEFSRIFPDIIDFDTVQRLVELVTTLQGV